MPIIATSSIPGYGLTLENPVNEVGFYFEVMHQNGNREQVGFALSGDFSFDTNREVCKVLGGFALIPQEAAKVNFSTDQIVAWLDYDGVRYPLGIFCFTEVSEQADVVLWRDPETGEELISDIYNVSMGDRTVLLLRNDGTGESLLTGFDPSQEMTRIMNVAGVPNSIPGSNGQAASPVSWDGSVTDLSKVRGLSELAGMRYPYMTNSGVVKAIPVGYVNDIDVYPVEKLFPIQGSIVVTPKYLGAPNRVIVSDNGFPSFALRGQWDAPSAAPHSYANLGYYRTEVVEQQGLGSGENANAVARRIGESYTARTLDFECMPTYLLDGPVLLFYREAFWIVQSWSISTEPGATMSVNAIEYLGG